MNTPVPSRIESMIIILILIIKSACLWLTDVLSNHFDFCENASESQVACRRRRCGSWNGTCGCCARRCSRAARAARRCPSTCVASSGTRSRPSPAAPPAASPPVLPSALFPSFVSPHCHTCADFDIKGLSWSRVAGSDESGISAPLSRAPFPSCWALLPLPFGFDRFSTWRLEGKRKGPGCSPGSHQFITNLPQACTPATWCGECGS